MQYWPWWIGAIALAGLGILYRVLVGRMIGVSGSWQRIARWREFSRVEKEEAKLMSGGGMMESGGGDSLADAFRAATLDAFGDAPDDALGNPPEAAVDTAPPPPTAKPTIEAVTVPGGAHLVFLLSMVIGALVTALYYGEFNIQYYLSDLHVKLSGGLTQSWFVLLLGGVMIGFGTQMGGGCTSGHALSGCAQMSPASLVATAVFFGAGIVFSLAVAYLAGV